MKDTAPKAGGGTATLADFTAMLDVAGKTTAIASSGTSQTNWSYSFGASDQLSAVSGSSVTFDHAADLARTDTGVSQSFDDGDGLRASTTTGGSRKNFAYDLAEGKNSVIAA